MKQMRSSLQNLSISYEIALAIGNSLNLSEMLHDVIHKMVHKTNAYHGIIWVNNGEKLQPVASAGINIKDVQAQGERIGCRDVFNQIIKREQFVLRCKDDKDFLQYCTVLSEKEESVLIVPVANVAIIYLVYSRRDIADKPLANMITGLSKKLGIAIEACMDHKNIINEVQVRVKAEKELTKKTEQLISGEKELQRLYGESEQARKSLLSILEDVEQKEEALREKEIYTRAIIEQSPISIQIFNKNGLTIDTNSAWGELWQLPSDELIGKYNVLEDEYAREIGALDNIEKAFKGETSFPFEIEYDPVKSRNPGRKRYIKCVVFPIKNKNGEMNRVVLMHEDITERKQAAEELAKHRENLEELVQERTKELEDKNKKLEKFNKLFVDREFRIKELRDKLKEVEGK